MDPETLENPLPHQVPGAKPYSLARAIKILSDPKNRGLNGLEGEVDKEIARRHQKFAGSDRVYFPWDATVSIRTSGLNLTTGAGAVMTTRMSVIDALRAKAVVAGLGAQFVTDLPRGSFAYPLKSSSASIGWYAEDGAPSSESHPSIASTVTYVPHQSGAFTDISRRFVNEAPGAIDLALADLAASSAVEIDRVALAGSGSGAEPTGLLFDAGVPVFGLGTNGLALTRAHVVAIEKTLGLANADVGSLGWATTPAVRAALRAVEVSAGSGKWLWSNRDRILSHPAVASTNMPATLSKGSGTGLSGLIFANWADLQIGLWTPSILVDYITFANSGGTRLVFIVDCDVHPRQAASFVAVKDVIA